MTRFSFLVAALVVVLSMTSGLTQQKKPTPAEAKALQEKPKPTDGAIKLDLVAKEPEIVTPTGITTDENGRIWVIENHTHQRAKNYPGPPSDRIRIFDDFDASGKARRATTFAEGFSNSMGLILGLLAIRSGSLLPGILFHVIYNSMEAVRGRAGDFLVRAPVLKWFVKGEPSAIEYNMLALIVAAVLASLLIAWLVLDGRKGKPVSEPAESRPPADSDSRLRKPEPAVPTQSMN